MAYTFNGTDQAIYWDTLPLSAPPFSVSVWFNPDGSAAADFIWSIFDKDEAVTDAFIIQTRADDTIDWTRDDGATEANNISTDTFTPTAWNHVGVRTASTSTSGLYINGGSATSNFETVNTSGLDRMAIGARWDTTATNHFPGAIAELAIWDSSISSLWFEMIHDGLSPLYVNPAPIFYAPLVSNTLDIIGGLTAATS